jgi:16S rRNA (cytosine967-C5)-methyltransferase
MIASYAARQIAIASNALAYLSNGGYFVYITCSVFKQENEVVVAQLMEKHSMQLLSSNMLDGTGIRSDSMFVAILKKP